MYSYVCIVSRLFEHTCCIFTLLLHLIIHVDVCSHFIDH